MQEYEFDFVLFKIPTEMAKRHLRKEKNEKIRELVSALPTGEDTILMLEET